MATVSQPDTRRMYSWWWDSHISPKNSKWLQENLTDMDSKIKQMIKLLEQDADSFARRAEMYYKKRPELMKLVEEFYRAYRALAERYDHATGALRQAHRTMAAAFPNHVPLVLTDESPSTSASEADPHTPEMPHPMRAFLDPDELQKDMLGISSSHFHALKRNGAFTEESDSVSRKGLKQLNDLFGSGEAGTHSKFAEGRARKGLNFHDVEERDQNVQHNCSHDIHARAFDSDRVDKAETEILNLKKALAKLETEKEAGLLQYQKSLERLSNLESEVSHAQEDSKGLNERASNAEAEVQNLKEALTRLQAERESSLLQYQQCLDKISNLEKSISSAQKDAGELNERAKKAETEVETLKQDLASMVAEKEATLVQLEQNVEMISNLENKILQAEENARRISEQADKTEHEVETLNQAIVKLTEEKEAAAFQCQQCLEVICNLEQKLSSAQEEAQRLNSEIENGVAKLKGAEERCLLLEKSKETLQFELDSLVLKVGSQGEELTEKQKELGRLWTCVQEERMRFMEAETAFQTLQHLHSQSQEELRSLVAELQNGAEVLQDLETRKQALENEVQIVKQENNNLNELNISSALSIKNLQDEILNLRETIKKLEEEVELRVDQRNALQQEIYCLKEELNDLNKQHQTMLEQVESVGFDPECFGSSVKELQGENSKLKEICEADRNEKVSLLEKLEIMEKLLEKNALLENSLADLNVELEEVRRKVKALEDCCRSFGEENSSLVTEKTNLISQLQITTENLGKLSEKNNVLENSLFDANAELEGLKVKSKSLEDSCLLLDDEKSGLISEKESLLSQLDGTQQRLEEMGSRYAELENKLSGLEKERDSALHIIEELRASLDVEKQEHASFAKLSESQLAGMEIQLCHLQEEGLCRKKEYEEEQDKALCAQIEILILQKCIEDLKEENFSLFIEHQKLLEAFQKSNKLISVLEHANIDQQEKVESFYEQNKLLREGLYQMLKTFDIDANHGCTYRFEQDQGLLNLILAKLKERNESLFRGRDENQQLVIENSILLTLLGQLRLEGTNLMSEKNTLDQEFRIQSEQLSLLQCETQKLCQMNEELRLKVVEGEHKEEVLMANIENLHWQLLDSQGAYQNLKEENYKVLEEKRSLKKVLSELEEEKRCLEEEINAMFGETMFHGNLSLVYNDIICKKAMELEELSEKLNKLHLGNVDLEKKVKVLDGKLADSQVENAHLKESLNKSDDELKESGGAYQNLKEENCKVLEEKRSLKKVVSELEDEKRYLEEEISAIFGETIFHGNLSLVFNDIIHEKAMELEELSEKLNKLHLCNVDLEKKVKILEGKLADLQVENVHLKESLNKSDNEMNIVKSVNDHLNGEITNSKDLLALKENETQLWETQATAFFGELQSSSICEALLEGKFNELIQAYENLENRSNSRSVEIKLLKEKVSTLEDANGGLRALSAMYMPAIDSLKDCMTSLEKHALTQSESCKLENEESKDARLMTLPSEFCQRDEDHIGMQPDGISDLQDMQSRIQAIEKAVVEKERLVLLENLSATTKLDAAIREIEELKIGSRNSIPENGHTSQHAAAIKDEEQLGHGLNNNLKLQRRKHEISGSGHEVLTKDIVLDHISESSSYGISKRETADADNQMLELWETTEQDGSIDLTVGKAQKLAGAQTDHHQIEVVREQRSAHPSMESLIEKELSVDKLEISKRFTEPRQEGNKKKILERLDSDAQKLANLQITIQDLKRKVEINEKNKKGKGIEFDTVKGQLEEAEETITKLCDVNRKLINGVEDGSLPSDGGSARVSDESGSVRRRRISEQARRGSEKIGRLQLEVQKLQFLLLKLDGERENRGRTRITERKTRVLLRDYLYGGVVRTGQKHKKAPFCACVQPPTKGD